MHACSVYNIIMSRIQTYSVCDDDHGARHVNKLDLR